MEFLERLRRPAPPRLELRVLGRKILSVPVVGAAAVSGLMSPGEEGSGSGLTSMGGGRGHRGEAQDVCRFDVVRHGGEQNLVLRHRHASVGYFRRAQDPPGAAVGYPRERVFPKRLHLSDVLFVSVIIYLFFCLLDGRRQREAGGGGAGYDQHVTFDPNVALHM